MMNNKLIRLHSFLKTFAVKLSIKAECGEYQNAIEFMPNKILNDMRIYENNYSIDSAETKWVFDVNVKDIFRAFNAAGLLCSIPYFSSSCFPSN